MLHLSSLLLSCMLKDLVIVDRESICSTVITNAIHLLNSCLIILDVRVIVDHLVMHNGGLSAWLLHNGLLKSIILDIIAADNYPTLDRVSKIGRIMRSIIVEC